MFFSLFYRSILEESKFSPLVDLEKNDKTGLLRLTDNYRLGQQNSAKRLELLEKNIIKYFRSRDEDNIKKPLPTINTTIMTAQPITPSTNKFVTRPITASTNKLSRSTDDDLSFHQNTSWIDDSNNSTINSSFWNYPLQYQSHDKNETVF